MSVTIFAVALGNDTVANQNATMSPVLAADQWRFVLTWDEIPPVLDSHLSGDLADSVNTFHVYYFDPGSSTADPYAVLEMDDTSSFGPETIAISMQNNGKYRYSVIDFTNGAATDDTALSASGAQVNVWEGSTLIATYNVPPNLIGNTWTVFELTGDTLTTINSITTTTDGAIATARFNLINVSANLATDGSIILRDLLPK